MIQTKRNWVMIDMAMDGLSLCAITSELQRLVGGKIDKVQQPERDALLFSVRTHTENCMLYLSASAENCRVQLTGIKRQNPQEPPMFCMLLRKRLGGGRIAGIEQIDMDRRINLTIEAQNELGENVAYTLAVEIMSRHSNIILVDENGTVIDAIKRVNPSMSSVRPVLPGMPYIAPPPQQKLDPRRAALVDFEEATREAALPKRLSAAFYGLAPDTSALLLEKLENEHEDTPLPHALYHFFQSVAKGEFTPCILCDESDVPIAALPFLPDVPERFLTRTGSMGEALDIFYEQRDALEHMKRRTASLTKILQNSIERVEKRLAMHTEALESDESMEQLRRYGSLITSNLYALKGNAEAAVLMDYEADPPQNITVPLDKRFSPAENAQRYFKKYQKAKAARDMAEKMREDALAELMYLEGQLDNLNKCTSISELTELRDELADEGYIHKTREEQARKRIKTQKSKPGKYISSDGFTIYVGKNNRQNDELTLKTAAPDNIWLHVKDIPGSHVIIDCHGEPTETALLEAAMLAAYYSKAKNAQNVPVDYTKRKFVKKPAHARPGMVIYSANRTIYVTPQENIIQHIKKED